MKKYYLGALLCLYLCSSLVSTAGISFFGGLLSLTFLYSLLIKKDFWVFERAPLPHSLFVAYILVTLISLAVNYYSGFAIRESFVDLRWVFLVYALTYSLHQVSPHEKYLKPFLWILILIGVYAIIQSFTGYDLKIGQTDYPTGDNRWRTTAFFRNPLTYANVFGAILCMLFSFFLFERRRPNKSYLYYAVAIITLIGVLLSQSRGVWLACFISILIVAVLHNRKKAVKIIGFFLAVIVCYSVFSPSFKDRLVSSFNPTQNQGRLIIWRAYFNQFQDHFWFGTGAGEHIKKIDAYASPEEFEKHPIRTHAHNQILDVLATRGIIGGLSLLGIFGYYMLMSYRLFRNIPADNIWHRKLALGCLGALICLFLSGLTETNIEDNEVTNIFALTLAIVTWLGSLHLRKTKGAS